MHIGKQGNLSQLGGEFVFGPGSSCQRTRRRIQSSRFHRQSMCLFIVHATHRGPCVLSVNDISSFLLTVFVIDVEVADLMKEVGVAFP